MGNGVLTKQESNNEAGTGDFQPLKAQEISFKVFKRLASALQTGQIFTFLLIASTISLRKL